MLKRLPASYFPLVRALCAQVLEKLLGLSTHPGTQKLETTSTTYVREVTKNIYLYGSNGERRVYELWNHRTRGRVAV
jgi:hypothetical protein